MKLPPKGLLGEATDQLLAERERLEAEAGRAWREDAQSRDAMALAEAQDKQLYVEELRKPDGKDPGTPHTDEARETAEAARRKHVAASEALDANTRDLADVLATSSYDGNLAERWEAKRTEALQHLEQLSLALGEWSELQGLREWAASPTKAGQLRPFEPTTVGVRLPQSDTDTIRASRLLDAVGKRLETAARFSSAQLVVIAKDCGLQCTEIRITRDGPTRVSKPPQTVQLRDSGLARVDFVRGSLRCPVVVAVSTLARLGEADLVRALSASVAAKFANPQLQAGEVLFADSDTETILASFRRVGARRRTSTPARR